MADGESIASIRSRYAGSNDWNSLGIARGWIANNSLSRASIGPIKSMVSAFAAHPSVNIVRRNSFETSVCTINPPVFFNSATISRTLLALRTPP